MGISSSKSCKLAGLFNPTSKAGEGDDVSNEDESSTESSWNTPPPCRRNTFISLIFANQLSRCLAEPEYAYLLKNSPPMRPINITHPRILDNQFPRVVRRRNPSHITPSLIMRSIAFVSSKAPMKGGIGILKRPIIAFAVRKRHNQVLQMPQAIMQMSQIRSVLGCPLARGSADVGTGICYASAAAVGAGVCAAAF